MCYGIADTQNEVLHWTIHMPHSKTIPAIDRLLSRSLQYRLSQPLRFVIATAAVLVVALFRAFVVTSILPWLLFVPVTLAIGLMLGRGPSVYASVLATAAAAISIASPDQPYWLTDVQWVASLIFLAISMGVGMLAAELRAAFARAQSLTLEKDDALARLSDRESFLSSVLASSTDCIKILDLDARLTFMSEGGQKIMEVSDFNAIAGCPWPDFWQGRGNAEARAAVAAAKAGESRSFVGNASTMAGTPKWWHVAVSPVRGPDGAPTGILSVSRDITAIREAQEESNRLQRVVENSTDFIGLASMDGTVFSLNDAGLDLVGLDRSALNAVVIADFFPPEEAEIVGAQVLPAVQNEGNWSGERLFRHFRTGELIPVLYTVFSVFDTDGTQIGYGTVTRDNRERHKAREQQQLLNDELSHRLKNVLAVVQSVAAQTLRQSTDLTAANDALAARLTALAQATDVLTAKSWAAADLHEIIRRTLAPHGFGDRIRLQGPAIVLDPQITLAFGLALHELATNAGKYGAMSTDAGHVDLTWSVTHGSIGEEPRFRLIWQEVGGPIVRPPTRQGFGQRMIERSLRSYFKGTAKLDFPSSGLVFTLDAPLGDNGKVCE